jgi:hypothetical protein
MGNTHGMVNVVYAWRSHGEVIEKPCLRKLILSKAPCSLHRLLNIILVTRAMRYPAPSLPVEMGNASIIW